MSEKPTYEELEQRVRELENAEAERKRMAESMHSLNEHLSFYRNAVGSMEDYKIAVVGPDYRYRIVSPQYLKIYNLTGTEIVGRTVAEIMGDDVFEHAIKPNLDRAMKGRTVHYSDWFELSDKGKRYLEISYYPVVDEDQKVVSVIAMSHDITEKRRVDEALCENEAKYRSLTENMNDILWTADLGMNINYVSPSIEKVLGFTVEERLKQSLQEQMPSETLQMAAERLTEELEFDEERDPERCATLELDYYHKDGSLRCLETTLSFIRDEHGKPVGIHGMSRDITERKRAEEALREERAFQGLLLDLATDFVNVPLAELDIAITDMLRKVGEFTNLDRVYLFMHDHLRRVTSNTHEWCREGIAAEKDNLQETPFDFFSDMLEAWEKGEIVHISSVAQMPEEHAMRTILEKQGIQSLVLIPLMQGKKNIGFVGFDAVKQPKSFSNREIALLNVLAEIISNAFDRKQAEEALNDERSFLSAVLDNIEEAVVTCDREGRLLRFNEAARSLHGLPEQPIPPDQWADYYDLYRMDGTTPLPTEEIPLFRALKGEHVQNAEIVVAPVHGGARSMVCSGQALTSEAGQVVGAVVAMHDITDRKQAEDALRESEEKHRALVDGLPDTVMRFDRDGRHLFVSDNVRKDVDMEPAWFIGKTHSELGFPEAQCRFWEESIRQVFDSGAPLETEFTFEGKAGPTIFNWRLVPEFDPEGAVQSLLSISRNITDRKIAEQDLERVRFSVENLTDSLFWVGEDGFFIDFNSAACERLGYSREELLKMCVSDIDPDFPQESWPSHWEEMKKCNSMRIETVHRARSGEFIPMELTIHNQQLGERRYNCVLGRDITERKRAEEELLAAKEKLNSILDNIIDVVWSISWPDFRHLYLSPSLEKLYGRSAQEFYDNPSLFKEVTHPDDRHLTEKAMEQLLEEGEAVRECRVVRPDGSIAWLIDRSKMVYDENQQPIRVDGVTHDFTERKLGEEALRNSEEKLSSFMDQVPGTAWITDKELRFGMSRGLGLIQMGLKPDQVSGKTLQEFFGTDDENHIAIRNHRRALQGESVVYEQTHESITYETRLSPMFDEQAAITGVLGVSIDITERKRAEEEREILQAQLTQSRKMEAIGTLAGGIAHDFNNILSIIVGNTEIAMLDVPEWSPAQGNLKEIRVATLRARELVKQILLFARQKEYTVSNISLEPIAKESIKMLRASIPTTVKINTKIKKGLPPVLADPTQIQQIIMNLCTNAGQAMEAEGGTLTFTLDRVELDTQFVTVAGVLPPGRYIRMQVRDTGPGIPSEIVERIFDPFFTTKGVGEGTGLGLAVVHGIVQDRKGGIIVDSEEGRGTNFTVYLPASEDQSVELTAEQKTELPRGTERVLFVDDEPMLMKLGQQMLERQGYKVETRASGTDALECFRQDPDRFDLVITDMTMPGMRGDRLAEEILVIRPEIPVILCTGYSRQISKEKAGEIGIRDFVMKPLTQNELANTVRRVLDEKSRK